MFGTSSISLCREVSLARQSPTSSWPTLCATARRPLENPMTQKRSRARTTSHLEHDSARGMVIPALVTLSLPHSCRCSRAIHGFHAFAEVFLPVVAADTTILNDSIGGVAAHWYSSRSCLYCNRGRTCRRRPNTRLSGLGDAVGDWHFDITTVVDLGGAGFSDSSRIKMLAGHVVPTLHQYGQCDRQGILKLFALLSTSCSSVSLRYAIGVVSWLSHSLRFCTAFAISTQNFWGVHLCVLASFPSGSHHMVIVPVALLVHVGPDRWHVAHHCSGFLAGRRRCLWWTPVRPNVHWSKWVNTAPIMRITSITHCSAHDDVDRGCSWM